MLEGRLRSLLSPIRWIVAFSLCMPFAGKAEAHWRIRGDVLEAGDRVPIEGANIICTAYMAYSCGSDFDGVFNTPWFGDTLCGMKMEVSAYGYKPSYFYIPWLKDDPSLYKTYRLTIYLQRDPIVFGTAFSALSEGNAKKSRRKDSTTVSLQVWRSPPTVLHGVWLCGNTADTLVQFTSTSDTLFRATVASGKVHTLAWQVTSGGLGAPRQQHLSLGGMVMSQHLDMVVDPPEHVKPVDWQPCSYPKVQPSLTGEEVPAPEPFTITMMERASWPGGEEAFFTLLYQRCVDITFKTAEHWSIFLRIDREGQMRVLSTSGTVRDTAAWQAIKNSLENEMPKWAPGKINGRPRYDVFYLMLDTEDLAANAKERRRILKTLIRRKNHQDE